MEPLRLNEVKRGQSAARCDEVILDHARYSPVHALASINDLANGELLDAGGDKVGQESRAELHLLVEVLL